ncbi:hypothetical protein [Halobacillus salinus]|uniref:hypothetical protein n=1 Tax=Halobacillus salinus TaxID=192814 RepID=UPI0009A77BBF|nr:hypothetical protein [Halobacillus salinus]
MADNRSRVGSLHLELDCEDALKGLKAVQREAKKATAALKELDNLKRHLCPKCGVIDLEVQRLHGDQKMIAEMKVCRSCGWEGESRESDM